MDARAEAVEGNLPEMTIQTLARGFFREAERYGFQQRDYLRFMSCLLDITNGQLSGRGPARAEGAREPADAEPQVSIRAFRRETDVDLIAGWVADSAGHDFLVARSMNRPLTLTELVDDPASVLGVVALPDGTPIGATAYLDYDPHQRKAELRKLIGDPGLRGRGYGKAATRLWVRYGFEELGLHKIYLSTLDTNLRNIRVNERIGFQLEGILHDEVLVDGTYHDVLRMAIWDAGGRETGPRPAGIRD